MCQINDGGQLLCGAFVWIQQINTSFTKKCVSGKDKTNEMVPLKKIPWPVKSSLRIWSPKSFGLSTIISQFINIAPDLFSSSMRCLWSNYDPKNNLNKIDWKGGHKNKCSTSYESFEILSKGVTTLRDPSKKKGFPHKLYGKFHPYITSNPWRSWQYRMCLELIFDPLSEKLCLVLIEI